MSEVKSRIKLLVESQGASRAARDIDGVGRSVDRIGGASGRSAKQMKAIRDEGSKFHRSLNGLSRVASGGVAALGALGAAAGVKAVGDFREAEKVSRSTAQTLKTMGGVAGISAKGVASLADALSLKTGFDDEAIQKGENVLLTFGKIRNAAGKGNDVFSRATKSAVDLAAAKNLSVTSTAEMLGKALQDPVTGAMALKRTGSLAADDLERLKNMAKSGLPVLQQQKFVLQALNKQYGGQAARQADPFDKARVAIDALSESIGYAIGPPLMRAATWLAKFVDQMRTGTAAGGKFRRALQLYGAYLGFLGRIVFKVGGFVVWSVGRQIEAWRRVGGAVSRVVGGAARRLRDLVSFVGRMPGAISKGASGMFNGIKVAFRDAINWIIRAWNGLQFKIPGFDPPGPGPKFGGFTLGAPDIPQLAHGGLVSGRGSWISGESGAELNTSDGVGRVRVQPLEGGGAGGGGRDIVINLTHILDGEVLSRSVRRHALRAAANASPA